MDTIRSFLVTDWPRVVIPLGVFAAILIAGWIAKRLVFRALERWADRSRVEIDNLVVEAVRRPFMIWVLILALYLAADASPVPEGATFVLGKILLGLWVLSFTVVATGVARNLVRYYGRHFQGVLPVTTLTENLASLAILIISALILLNMLGVSITPILTALGVGGLAVALALQDTLANLFAGFYISVAGQYRVGDYIKLDSSEEGYITDITWRSTTIRALQNNLIIIPNSQLAKAIVTNYHLPEKRLSVSVPVSVSYDSDPDEVERILIQEATNGAREIPGLLAEPQPFVRFIPGFGDSSLDFTLICQAREFVDQYLVQHELRKRIFRRFRLIGIEIPFPIRTVYLRKQAGAPEGTQPEGAGNSRVVGPS